MNNKLPLYQIYYLIHKNFTPYLLKEEKHRYEVINENKVKAIWYEGRFNQCGLKTVSGENIAIHSPGMWNIDVNNGPDFINGKIQIGEKSLTGDIEIDVYSSNWISHKHHQNKLYNNVVLYVVFVHNTDKELVKENGEKLEILELRNAVEEASHWYTDEEKYLDFRERIKYGLCSYKVTPDRYSFMEQLFTTAGFYRLICKSEEYSGLESGGVEQKLYTKLLESMGYQFNKENMRRVAILLPWEKLKFHIANCSVKNKIRAIQALLFYVAGMLPDSEEASWDEESKLYYRECKEALSQFSLEGMRVMRRADWVFKKVRPMNFPQRRLAGISYIFGAAVDDGLAGLFLKYADWMKEHNGGREVCRIFIVSGEDYFGVRCDFGRRKFKRKYDLIGKERANSIVINIFLPFLYWYARKNNNEKLRDTAEEFYKKLKVAEENHIARLMLYRVFGRSAEKFKYDREIIQQGLIQIFTDFCGYIPNCNSCVLPKVLDLTWEEILLLK
jgi:hypothetical protein